MSQIVTQIIGHKIERNLSIAINMYIMVYHKIILYLKK